MDTSRTVEPSLVELSEVLAALADDTRLRIVELLVAGSRCVCELLAEVPVAPNVLSYHLKVLRDAGLVTAERRGRFVDYSLDRTRLGHLRDALPADPVAVP